MIKTGNFILCRLLPLTLKDCCLATDKLAGIDNQDQGYSTNVQQGPIRENVLMQKVWNITVISNLRYYLVPYVLK